MKPIVTVLMTVYNGKNYLNEAIESVFSQTLNNYEFLIVDDASTDNSIEIINSYKDSRIKLLTNRENIGQTASLNKGLAIAQGKYIARLDQDDICLPKRLEEQVAFFNKNPSISIVCSREYSIDKQGKRTGIWKRDLNNYGTFLGYIVLGLNPIWTTSVMFVKDVFLQLGKFDVSYGAASDFEYWSRIALKRLNAKVVPEFHQLRRIHDQSQSNLMVDEQYQATKRALSNVITYFIDKEDNRDLLSILLLESLKIKKFNKKDLLIVSKKIYTLIENISLKQNLNKDEIASLKVLIFRRIGHGFKIGSSLNLLPLPLFKIIFYLASPMYITSLRKLFSVTRYKIRGLMSYLKNI